jgi:hypothetical protein
MGHRCLNKNGKNPSYSNVELRMTLEEWLTWAVPEYARFDSDHHGEMPNISRFMDKGHYEIGNLRIGTRRENQEEFNKHSIGTVKPDGTKECSACTKILPTKMFNKRKSTLSGFDYNCKSCVKGFQNGMTVEQLRNEI